MRTTVDSGGRLVIPKALRDRLGIAPGEPLDVRERDGRIEIEPSPTAMRLSKRRHGVVAVPASELPPLTDDLVRATLERTRR